MTVVLGHDGLDGLSGTAWVARAVKSLEEPIRSTLGPGFLPSVQAESGSRKKAELVELGCGHYGCVLATETPSIVLKLTTDPTEAWFVAWLLAKQERASRGGFDLVDDPSTAGIVRYHAVYKSEAFEHKKKALFAIWREEAQDVGRVFGAYLDQSYQERQLRTSRRVLDIYSSTGRALFQGLYRKVTPETWAGLLTEASRIESVPDELDEFDFERTPAEHVVNEVKRFAGSSRPRLLAYSTHVMSRAAEWLGNIDGMSSVGSTLGYIGDQGILLADLHAGNLGRRLPIHGGGAWNDVIITDPGHAFPIRTDHQAVTIPTL